VCQVVAQLLSVLGLGKKRKSPARKYIIAGDSSDLDIMFLNGEWCRMAEASNLCGPIELARTFKPVNARLALRDSFWTIRQKSHQNVTFLTSARPRMEKKYAFAKPSFTQIFRKDPTVYVYTLRYNQ